MKKIIFTPLLLFSLFSLAQPSGYTAGTQTCWTFNGRPHGYFKSAGSGERHILISFTGDGETNCNNFATQAPQKWFNSPTNWNGKTVRAPGDTIVWEVLTLVNLGYNEGQIASDIEYFFANIAAIDTCDHTKFHTESLSGGVGRMWGYLVNDQSHNSPYRFIFSTTISQSGTWLGPISQIHQSSVNLRNWVWYGTADMNGGTPPAASQQLYDSLQGSKRLTAQSGGDHSGLTWDSCMSLKGSDTTTNRWMWMVEIKTPKPVVNAGNDTSITTSSYTLQGSAADPQPGRTISSYSWAQLSGPNSASFSSTSVAQPTVSGLVSGTYSFALTATDNCSASSSDTVQVVVNIGSDTLAQTAITIPTDQWHSANALLYLPQDYNSTSSTTTYPLLLYFHDDLDAGSSVGDLSKLLSKGVPKLIHDGNPMEFTVNSTLYKFIVVSPQSPNNGWLSEANMDAMIEYLKATYKVDTSRIYLTGITEGASNCINYVATSSTFADKISAVACMSIAGTDALDSSSVHNITNSNVRSWFFCQTQDSLWLYSFSQNANGLIANIKSDITQLTSISSPASGHQDAWIQGYDVTRTPLNVFQWMLQYTNTTPEASAPPILHMGLMNAINGAGTPGVLVYPNPGNSLVRLDLSSLPAGMRQITVSDAGGRTWKVINTSQDNYSLDVSSLNKGIYFIKIKSNNYQIEKKLIRN